MATLTYDLIVIGSGPGGYVAAIRAAQLGMKVVCVERDQKLGGICLNWGCIPTKALLRSAEVLDLCRRAAEFGVKIDGEVGFDFAEIMKRSRKIVDAQEKGIHFLFKKYKVEPVVGTARLLGGGQVGVKGAEGTESTLAAKHIILATGARAKSLPGVEIDGKRVIEYRGALSLPAVPETLAVIGAGAIGVEFASFYQTLGTEVTLIEYLPRIVPLEDEEVSQTLLASFKKRKIRCLVGHKVTGVATSENSVVVSVEDRNDPAKKLEVAAEIALMATGIAANVDGIGLEAAGVKVDRGFVTVDDVTYATSAAGIYAIGDMAGPPALAHVASAEGIACVERISGLAPEPIDYGSIPACTFCHPEIGSIGLTEAQAREQKARREGRKVPLPRARQGTRDDRDGWVREGDLRRRGWAGHRRAHHWTGRVGLDRRVWPGQDDRSERRELAPHRPRPPDAGRGVARGHRGRDGARDPYLIEQ